MRRWMCFIEWDAGCVSLNETLDVFHWMRRWMCFIGWDAGCVSLLSACLKKRKNCVSGIKLQLLLQINCVEQTVFWEVNTFLIYSRISLHFMESIPSLRIYNTFPPESILSHRNLTRASHHSSLKCILTYHHIYAQVLQVVTFFQS